MSSRRRGSSLLRWPALLLTLAGWTAPAVLSAQRPRIVVPSPDELQVLTLVDGSRLVGRVVDAGEPVVFELQSGDRLRVERARVAALDPLEGVVRGGRIWEPDPSDNRLFFGPTGRTIGVGQGFIAVFEAVFPSVAIGLHDRVTVGGGTLLLSDLDGDRPVWFIPKVKVFERPGAALSVGALAISTMDGDDGWVGVLYGVGTFGSPDSALTLGLGYGWIDDDLADQPAVLVGGEVRVAHNVKLITENYLIPTGDGYDAVVSLGPRFFGDRLSADLGVAMALVGRGALFPLVNFVYNW